MSSSPVEIEQLGPVVRLTLARPDHMNPLSAKCIRAIVAAVERADGDKDTKVVIIRGSGRAFSSGYGVAPEDFEPDDYPEDQSIQDDVAAMIDLGTQWAKVWNCRLPVIAQVHGYCLAGGADLALHCDMIVAAEDAKLGFPPVRSMGVPPTHMWLYHLGPQWTKRLVLSGDTITGARAAELGLVLEAVPAADLDAHVLALAQRIALVGRDLLIGNKRVVNEGVELMGRSQLQRIAAVQDAVAHQAPEAIAFGERARKDGLKAAVRERDAPFNA